MATPVSKQLGLWVFGAITVLGTLIAPSIQTTNLQVTNLTDSMGNAGSFHVRQDFTAATTTPASVQNTSGRVRLVTAVQVMLTAGTNVGSVSYKVGTSTTPYAATVSPMWNGALTVSATTQVSNVTSTIVGTGGVYYLWQPNEYINALSSSTTNNGTLRIQYL